MSLNFPGRAVPRLDLGMAWMEYVYQQSYPEFIALDVLPNMNVAVVAAKFASLTREAMLSRADTARASRSGYNRVDQDAEDKSFSCSEHGLEGLVDDRERVIYQNDLDQELATLVLIMRKVKLAQEIRVAGKVFNTTTFTGADLFTDISASPWDTADSAIISKVIAAKEKVRKNSGTEANCLIVGRSQAENLLQNTEIKNQFPGAPLITMDMLRQALPKIFGLPRMLVGSAVYNSADEGQTFSGSDVWSETYAMVAHVVESSSAPLPTPGLGRTFNFLPDSAEEILVEQYRDEEKRGDVLRCRHDVEENIITAEFGHLLQID